MEAILYHRLGENRVQCNLCQHQCVIAPGKRGICGVRENREGALFSMVYGQAVARHVDPIEKKPLFHVLPGSLSYSVATVGCNFRCLFCQNAQIAQPAERNGSMHGISLPPERIVDEALHSGCRTIAYTYTEPTVFFEYAYDTARLAANRGLKNVFVTNGYMSAEAVDMIAPYLDAANVDLKGFSDTFYKNMAGAVRGRVLETLKNLSQAGVFLEVTTLLIPGANDDSSELAELAGWIRDNLGPQTPWHVSRFHPAHKLTDRASTPVETILVARRIGKDAGLHYVYTGNIAGRGEENTACHDCGHLLIERVGYTVTLNRLKNGSCPNCGASIPGIWT